MADSNVSIQKEQVKPVDQMSYENFMPADCPVQLVGVYQNAADQYRVVIRLGNKEQVYTTCSPEGK